MSLRKSFARFVVPFAPILLFSVNPIQSPAQSRSENPNAIAPLYKMTSVKPSKAGIDADRTTKIAPDEVTVANETAQELIQGAYDIKDDQIVGAPAWLNSQRYDIDAKVDTSATGQDELEGKHMVQALLSSRFKLAVHSETKLIPAYELVTAGDGPKLRESVPIQEDSALRVIDIENGRIKGREVPIATLARILSEELGRPVLDKTQLSSHYDVTLQWPAAPESPEPAILTAIQEQLGLKLVPQLMSQDQILGYQLVIADDGPKLQESAPAFAVSAPPAIQVESGRIMGRDVPIATLARILSVQLGRPILDKTQLSSHYDLTLQWRTAVPDSSKPAILNAVQEQLGLKLVPQLMPKDFLVIDHVEMPVAE